MRSANMDDGGASGVMRSNPSSAAGRADVYLDLTCRHGPAAAAERAGRHRATSILEQQTFMI